MERIIKFCTLYYVICVFLFLTGCKNTEHVFLKNDTNKKIVVQIYLLTKNGEQIMETSIAPDDSDGWSYETGAVSNKEFDKRFRKLIITNNKGCQIELDRNEMNGLISKSGAWKLVIDKNIMNCD